MVYSGYRRKAGTIADATKASCAEAIAQIRRDGIDDDIVPLATARSWQRHGWFVSSGRRHRKIKAGVLCELHRASMPWPRRPVGFASEAAVQPITTVARGWICEVAPQETSRSAIDVLRS